MWSVDKCICLFGSISTVKMYPIQSEPAIPTPDMSVLASLNTNQLKDLFNNDEQFMSLMKDQTQENKNETEKQLLQASTRSLAEFNLKREKELTEGKQKLEESTLEGERLIQSIKEKIAFIKDKSKDKNETMLALLQTNAAEAEEESEDIATKFLDRELDVESFLEQFHSSRKLMHLRRVKADKMSDLLNKPHVERPSSPPSTVYSPGFNSHYPVSHQPAKPLPYPTGNFNMPTPIMPPRY